MLCAKQAATKGGMWRDLLQTKQEHVLLMSFSSSAVAHGQVGDLKSCRLLRHVWGSSTGQLRLQTVWICLTLANTGAIRREQSWQHGTHGLATRVFALGSANILHPTLFWGSCMFCGVWGLLPHPLPTEEQSPLPLSAACSPSPLWPPSLRWHLFSPLQQDVVGSPWAAFPIQAHFSANEIWGKK